MTCPQLMGILNVTEDSFYENSRLRTDYALLEMAHQHIVEGANVLDLGGFSTRPGALEVSEELEIIRVQSALLALKKEFPQVSISVDTFRGKVAQVAIDHGATIINDISGFQFDKTLLSVIGNQSIPYVLMHVEGDFHTMHAVQENPHKQADVVERVITYFKEKLVVLHENGVENVILDPGFGFSKTLSENHELLHRLDELKEFQLPILVGVSRKSMIYKKLGISPEASLNGTTVLNTIAILKGASILRVHDVKACKEAVDLICDGSSLIQS